MADVNERLHLVAEVTDHVISDFLEDRSFDLAQQIADADFEVSCFVALGGD